MQFDETDLLLVNALQIAPRASWAQLHAATGLDAGTLAARWQRLSSAGLAWTTCYPDFGRWRAAFAYVEVDCVPGMRDAVAAQLIGDPETISIECTTGRRDLFLSIQMRDIAAIDRYVSDRVGVVSGVVSTRTHHIRRYYREGSDWRVRALSTLQQRRVANLVPPHDEDVATRYTPMETAVITALGHDARRSASSIAEELDVSVSTVSRIITRLVRTRRANLRCDIAHELSPWNVIAVLWISARHSDLPVMAETMMRYPQLRQCCSIASEANFMVQTWMRDLGELDMIEQALAQASPSMRVLDRWVVSRIPKRLGHVTAPDGRRSGFVPLRLAD